MATRNYLPAKWKEWTPAGTVQASWLVKPYKFNALATPQYKLILRYKLDSPECNQMMDLCSAVFEECMRDLKFAGASERKQPFRPAANKVGDEWVETGDGVDFTFASAVRGMRSGEATEFPPPLLFPPAGKDPIDLMELPRGTVAKVCCNIRGYNFPSVGIKLDLKGIQYKTLGQANAMNTDIVPPSDLLTPEEQETEGFETVSSQTSFAPADF